MGRVAAEQGFADTAYKPEGHPSAVHVFGLTLEEYAGNDDSAGVAAAGQHLLPPPNGRPFMSS